MSKLIHLFTNLPDPSQGFLSELSGMFYKFLWDGKPSKLSKTYVCGNYGEGGIRMLDVHSSLSALKVSWLRRIMFSDSIIKQILLCSCPEVINLEMYGCEYVNVLLMRCPNPFWIDVFKHYKFFCTKCIPRNVLEFFGENIHYNINITRDKKTVHLKEWIENGIISVGHLVNDSGNFLSFDDFKQKFPDVNTNFLIYQGVIEAIKRYKQKTGFDFNIEYSYSEGSKAWSYLKCGNTKLFYSLLANKEVQPPCIKKWEESYIDNSFNWKKLFLLPFTITLDNQLRWFQLRVLHRRIPTKRFLYHCKISESPLCSFCNNEEETIIHMLWSCPLSQKFWSDLSTLINEKCQNAVNFVFDEMLVIFGLSRRICTDSFMDFVLLFAKFYLYKNKIQNIAPNIKAFIISLKYRYVIEKNRQTVNGQQEFFKFCQNWLPYQALLESYNSS